MTGQTETKTEPWPVKHDLRHFTNSDEDFEEIWQLWQTIFPKWPVERQRMEKLLHQLPGHHHIHEKGFCLSFLENGAHGKIAAVGVLPEYRGKGLGTAFMEKAQAGLRDVARASGEGELKSLEIGSQFPRFWLQMPTDFPPEVKDFFLHRGASPYPVSSSDKQCSRYAGFHKSTEPAARDLYRDIRGPIAPPEVLERVSKMNLKFSPWSPELYEECVTKQRALFVCENL